MLVYSTAAPEDIQTTRALPDGERISLHIETALAEIAAGLAQDGTRKFVIAGGETSGAVVQRLGIDQLRIGPAIDPGVPWTWADGPQPVALALKSGNFGSVDFFEKALARLP